MLRPTSPRRSVRALAGARPVAPLALTALLLAGGCSMLPRADRPGHEPDAPIVSSQPVTPPSRTTLQSPMPGTTAATPAPLPPTSSAAAAGPVQPGQAMGSGAASAPPAPGPSSPSIPVPATAEGGTSPAARAAVTVSPIAPPPTGLYRCEADRRAMIRRVSDDGQRIVLNWAGADHTLVAARATPGASIRWQDTRAGLAWVVADGHSLLLDLRQGRPLAADCRL